MFQSTVALLVQHGAKIDLQAGAGKNNFTALLFAAEQGHLNVVKKLVELGASPDIKGKHCAKSQVFISFSVTL